jgi:hypothetical protein
VKLVRETAHYTPEMVESVFRQNHLNAAIVEIIVFAFFILMGLFKDYSLFKIPAGASVILIFSMFIMLSSAFRFWLKAWSTSVLISIHPNYQFHFAIWCLLFRQQSIWNGIQQRASDI